MKTTVTQSIDLLCALLPGGEIVKSKHFFFYDLSSAVIKKEKKKPELIVFLSLHMYSDRKFEKLMQSISRDNTHMKLGPFQLENLKESLPVVVQGTSI